MAELDFPNEAMQYLGELSERLLSDEYYFEALKECEYLTIVKKDFPVLEAKLKHLSEKSKIHPYEFDMIYLLFCLKTVRENYKIKGYSDKLFIDTMLDIKYKLFECYNLYKLWGTFVSFWFYRHLNMELFSLGRFQYEKRTFLYDEFKYNDDITIKKDDLVINLHIPSSGPLSKDVRMNSYKAAYDFYKKNFPDTDYIIFVCDSWLLYPEYEKVYDKGSNLYSFLNDFKIIHPRQHGIENLWRVYNCPNDTPIAELPENTSLQRNFKKWLLNGGTVGNGYGVIAFDGKNIIK